MGKGEKHKSHEVSPVNRLTDNQLIQTLQCPGFLNVFDIQSLTFSHNGYGQQYFLHTGAVAQVKRGTITGVNGEQYSVSLIRDLDNAGVHVTNLDGKVVTKVSYRDRRCDGTPEATPPTILRYVGGVCANQIPERSKEIGATSWYYSGPTDVELPERKSVEFSIASSNPLLQIEDLLKHKEGKLSVNPKMLASFIDNPFAYIPFDQPNKENIDKWWTLWWHVVQRGLREKKIPYPGQTSQSGFTGFFDHVLHESKALLEPLGYTHLSGVPTWGYVWNLNLKNGFQPDDVVQHQEALTFFDKVRAVTLPDGRKLEELNYKSGLHSWLAVAPFIMQLNPSYEPELHIDHKYVNGDFKALFGSMKKQLVTENNEVWTYPLAPGRNLWHSLELNG